MAAADPTRQPYTRLVDYNANPDLALEESMAVDEIINYTGNVNWVHADVSGDKSAIFRGELEMNARTATYLDIVAREFASRLDAKETRLSAVSENVREYIRLIKETPHYQATFREQHVGRMWFTGDGSTGKRGPYTFHGFKE